MKMVRLAQWDNASVASLRNADCPEFDNQPWVGRATPQSTPRGTHFYGGPLANWFWRETAAGKGLFALQERWKHSGDRTKRLFSRTFLVPRANKGDSPYVDTSG